LKAAMPYLAVVTAYLSGLFLYVTLTSKRPAAVSTWHAQPCERCNRQAHEHTAATHDLCPRGWTWDGYGSDPE